jgi:hypothetical protein
MKCCNSEPKTTFESCIDKEIMDYLKKKLELDPKTPLIIVAPDRDNNIKLLTEKGKYKPGLPEKEVAMKHIESFSIIRSQGSNYTTVTSGGNSWSEDVDW